jgi:periplasmic nitrate reductase NapD
MLHIASLIARTRPEAAHTIAHRLAQLSGVEVHAVQDGKLILVLEDESEKGLADRMDQIRGEAGVLLVSLVYHEVEGA